MSCSKNGIMPYQKGLIAQESFTLRLVPNLKQIYKTKPQSYKEWYALEKRILTSIEKLHLEDVYQAHIGFAADVLRNRYIFCDEYIEMLHRRFPQADFSMQDAKEMLYCHDIQPANWGKNILAKLAYDMDAEME